MGTGLDVATPKAILFDWDNTLVDSWGPIHEALNFTFAAMGKPAWTLAEARTRVRHSLRDSFPLLFGDSWEDARDLYLTHFEAIHLDRLSPLPGAADLLVELHAKGIYLAVVSNKTGRLLRREVAALGWQHWFSHVVGAGDATADKPDAAPAILALSSSGIPANQEVWFVGDTDIDLVCAINAGCLPVLLGTDATDTHANIVTPAFSFENCHALREAVFLSSHLQYERRIDKLGQV